MTTWLAVAEPAADPFSGLRYPLLAMVVALVATVLATPWVRKFAIARNAVDDPARDDRRVHTTTTPRWGGIAIYIGVAVSLAAVLPIAYPFGAFPAYLWAILGFGGLIVGLGALDDVRPLDAKWQLLYLLGVGVAVQFVGDRTGVIQVAGMELPIAGASRSWTPFGVWAIPITALYIFVVTKTMDTIDGIDGLAAGISAIAGGTLSIIAAYEGQPRVALVAAAASGAAIGFLRYNYNPAKIFMGTGGAQFLGFLLAALSVVGALKTAAALALFIPLLVFGVPMIDAAVVVVRRVLGGHPVTQADKRHIHHALLKTGLSQRQTVWVLYLFALALGGVLVTIVRLYG